MDYERKPDAIYDQSFAIIEEECDLSRFNDIEKKIAIRMIHACGDTSIAKDISISPDAVTRFTSWAQNPKTIICDVNMVKMGIMQRYIPKGSDLISAIDGCNLELLAPKINNTRTAAGIHLLKSEFADSIIVIGNAPTALFHLLELIEEGYPPPKLIIGCPVGFVGAAESKDALIAAKYANPCLSQTGIISLKGRLGGSAIASAAFNALSKTLLEEKIAEKKLESLA